MPRVLKLRELTIPLSRSLFISMPPTDFDVLEAVARGVREDPRPFGGVQLVLSGGAWHQRRYAGVS